MTQRFNFNRINLTLMLAFLLTLSLLIAGRGTVRAEDARYFPETGHSVNGKFLQYWNANGGLATYGYPITDAQNEVDPETGKTFLTQWFERNRFELHQENAGTKYEVLLGLLGKDLNRNRLSSGPFGRSSNNGSGNYYNETGHNLSGRFLEYWSSNGGLERFGFPISEEFQDVDPETGKMFVMQWFERARFEKHPENARPYDVLLGLLGKQIKGGNQAPVFPNFSGKVDFSSKFILESSEIGNVVVDNQDNLYLADEGNAKILKYTNNGQFITSWDVPATNNGSSGGFSLKSDGKGNIYIQGDEGAIEKYNSSGKLVSKIQLSVKEETLLGVDSLGNLYGTGSETTITKFNNNGSLLASWSTHEDSISPYDDMPAFVTSLVVNEKEGSIYIVRSHQGSATLNQPFIQKYDNQGRFLKSWSVQPFPSDLTIDQGGNLYFLYGAGSSCRFWGGAVKYGSDGNEIVSWGDYQGTCEDHNQDSKDGVIIVYATGIAVDSRGNIYTVDHPWRGPDTTSASRIQKFIQR